jgi:hypothetical protein
VVFVIQIDVAGVFLSDRNVWHRDSPFSLGLWMFIRCS